jgi:hypothetical protein
MVCFFYCLEKLDMWLAHWCTPEVMTVVRNTFRLKPSVAVLLICRSASANKENVKDQQAAN